VARKWLFRILLGLVALYAIYVLGANLFLNTDLAFGLINGKPEKLHVSWSSGSTFWPGRVKIEGLEIRGQSRKTQWYCAMPGGSFRIELLGLLSKEIRVREGEGRGFDFRIRRRITAEEALTELVDWLPEIPGFRNPPDPRPEDLYPPPKPKKRTWHIRVGRVDLEGPVSLWFNRMQIVGQGSVGGSLDYRLRHEMEIPAAELRLEDGRFLIDAAPFAEQIEGTVQASFRPFIPRGARGLRVLDFLAAEVSVPSAVVPDLDVFDPLFPPRSGLSIRSGSASLEGQLSMAEAGTATGSFDLRAEGLDIVSLEAETQGDLELLIRLQKGDLARGLFDVAGTRIHLENIVDSEIKVTQKEPWWARFELLDGDLAVGRPMTLSTNIQLALKDSKPLTGLFGAKAVPNIKELGGTVQLDLDAEMLSLEPMELEGKGMKMKGRLGLGQSKARGGIYVKYKGIPIAVNLTGEKTKLVLARPLRWFEAQPSVRAQGEEPDTPGSDGEAGPEAKGPDGKAEPGE
jgi:hypothetical protein